MLSQKIAELQRVNKNSIENEVKRLGTLLLESDNRIKERDEEIARMKQEMTTLVTESYRKKGAAFYQTLEAENTELKLKYNELEQKYDEANAKIEELKSVDPNKPVAVESSPMVSPMKDVQKKMKKEIQKVYRNIVNLSKIISELLKGEEPNMQALWGIAHDKDSLLVPSAEAAEAVPDSNMDELTIEDLTTLQNAIEKIKTSICDYYAEKYSNECNIQ